MKILKIQISEHCSGVFLIKLEGPLDTYTHETLDHYIDQVLLNSPRNIILDMQHVHYISSMGVGSLFKIRKFADEKKINFSMANLQPQVEAVLNTVDAMPAATLFKSRKEMDDYLDALQKKKLGEDA